MSGKELAVAKRKAEPLQEASLIVRSKAEPLEGAFELANRLSLVKQVAAVFPHSSPIRGADVRYSNKTGSISAKNSGTKAIVMWVPRRFLEGEQSRPTSYLFGGQSTLGSTGEEPRQSLQFSNAANRVFATVDFDSSRAGDLLAGVEVLALALKTISAAVTNWLDGVIKSTSAEGMRLEHMGKKFIEKAVPRMKSIFDEAATSMSSEVWFKYPLNIAFSYYVWSETLERNGQSEEVKQFIKEDDRRFWGQLALQSIFESTLNEANQNACQAWQLMCEANSFEKRPLLDVVLGLVGEAKFCVADLQPRMSCGLGVPPRRNEMKGNRMKIRARRVPFRNYSMQRSPTPESLAEPFLEIHDAKQQLKEAGREFDPNDEEVRAIRGRAQSVINALKRNPRFMFDVDEEALVLRDDPIIAEKLTRQEGLQFNLDRLMLLKVEDGQVVPSTTREIEHECDSHMVGLEYEIYGTKSSLVAGYKLAGVAGVRKRAAIADNEIELVSDEEPEPEVHPLMRAPFSQDPRPDSEPEDDNEPEAGQDPETEDESDEMGASAGPREAAPDLCVCACRLF